MKRPIIFALLPLIFLFLACPNQKALEQSLQQELDTWCTAEGIPGATLAIVLQNGKSINIASGFSDKEQQTPMKPEDEMLLGSVGKTYVSGLALQLVDKGKLNLDDKVASFFKNEPWLDSLPNAQNLTVKMLMNHTSGIPRYVFKKEFVEALHANTARHWQPVELIRFIFGDNPLHNAGKGWGYSDTNYILLGMIMEKVMGDTYYNQLKKRILTPNNFVHTYPSDKNDLPNLIPGYIGENNFFNLPEKVNEKGLYPINPQFEWTGGGLVTNTLDLASWMQVLHGGKFLSEKTYNELIQAVDFKTGEAAKAGYGLGTFVWQTDEGIYYGHAGIMPGYLTQTRYHKDLGFSIALQINTDQGLGRNMNALILKIGGMVKAHLRSRSN